MFFPQHGCCGGGLAVLTNPAGHLLYIFFSFLWSTDLNFLKTAWSVIAITVGGRAGRHQTFFFNFKVYYFPHALNVRYKFVEEHANFSSFHEQFHEFPLELAVATLSRTNFKNTSLLYDFYETVNMVGLQTFRLPVSTNIDKCLTWACELHKTGQKVSTKENCLVKTDLFFFIMAAVSGSRTCWVHC